MNQSKKLPSQISNVTKLATQQTLEIQSKNQCTVSSNQKNTEKRSKTKIWTSKTSSKRPSLERKAVGGAVARLFLCKPYRHPISRKRHPRRLIGVTYHVLFCISHRISQFALESSHLPYNCCFIIVFQLSKRIQPPLRFKDIPPSKTPTPSRREINSDKIPSKFP